jgi:hypothetical protein
LPIAQLAYNNKLLELTKITPFFANYRRNPNLFKQTLLGLKAKAAITTAEELLEIYKLLRAYLKKA